MHILQVVHKSIPLFTELEWWKVFEKFNDNKASNNENIIKVHNLPGHPLYIEKPAVMVYNSSYLSHILRPTFWICENKDIDQRLCFG